MLVPLWWPPAGGDLPKGAAIIGVLAVAVHPDRAQRRSQSLFFFTAVVSGRHVQRRLSNTAAALFCRNAGHLHAVWLPIAR